MKLLFILLLGLGFTQTKLETRVYDLTLSNQDDFNIYEVTGYNLEYFQLEFMNATPNNEFNDVVTITIEDEIYGSLKGIVNGNYYGYDIDSFYYAGVANKGIFLHPDNLVFKGNYGPWSIKIAVTAEFPEEDTGYIEEGYQFCVQPGANLLSFPCDNPISVNQSLPQGAENFITQIVGQGVATTYNPALGWVGSLDNFSPGSGYWFKSNESLCFEYDCVED